MSLIFRFNLSFSDLYLDNSLARSSISFKVLFNFAPVSSQQPLLHLVKTLDSHSPVQVQTFSVRTINLTDSKLHDHLLLQLVLCMHASLYLLFKLMPAEDKRSTSSWVSCIASNSSLFAPSSSEMDFLEACKKQWDKIRYIGFVAIDDISQLISGFL